MFFAPSQAEKRLADWGGARFQQELTRAWQAFLQFMDGRITLETHNGHDAAEKIYRKILSGDFDPGVGYILNLWEADSNQD